MVSEHLAKVSVLGTSALIATAAVTWVLVKKAKKVSRPKSVNLVYFDIAGVAEAIRLTFAYGGVNFEDTRIAFADWAAMKPTTPLHQLPVLKLDGKDFPQSVAILRYAGKLSGLYPEDAIAALQCDSVLDTVSDMAAKVSSSIHEKDEGKKADMRKDLAAEQLPFYFSKLESMLQANGGKSFAGSGGSLSIADISVMTRLKWLTSGILDGIPTTILDPYIGLMGLIDTVMTSPAIAAYYAAKQQQSS